MNEDFYSSSLTNCRESQIEAGVCQRVCVSSWRPSSTWGEPTQDDKHRPPTSHLHSGYQRWNQANGVMMAAARISLLAVNNQIICLTVVIGCLMLSLLIGSSVWLGSLVASSVMCHHCLVSCRLCPDPLDWVLPSQTVEHQGRCFNLLLPPSTREFGLVSKDKPDHQSSPHHLLQHWPAGQLPAQCHEGLWRVPAGSPLWVQGASFW